MINFYPALSKMRKADFSETHAFNRYNYIDMAVEVSRDFLNDRWFYFSEEPTIGGFFIGSVEELKKQIKAEYHKQKFEQQK